MTAQEILAHIRPVHATDVQQVDARALAELLTQLTERVRELERLVVPLETFDI